MPHIGVESFSVALRYQLLATGRFVSALATWLTDAERLHGSPYPLRIFADRPSEPSHGRVASW